MFGLSALQLKLLGYLLSAVSFAVFVGVIFMFGHHVGSNSQLNKDDAKIALCAARNAELSAAIKTDEATITGLKEANAEFARNAAINEDSLKQANADLAQKLARQHNSFGKRDRALEGAIHANANSCGSSRVPDAIIDGLQYQPPGS